MTTPATRGRRAHGRPLKSPLAVAGDYEEKTINAYVAPGKNLDAWLTANSIEGDFTVADTALLNRYFREYYLERGSADQCRASSPLAPV